ncbi:hypothetical protein, partial [Streptomyces tendae]
ALGVATLGTLFLSLVPGMGMRDALVTTLLAQLSARVVFVPLGYGPKVAARAARLALLQGVEAAEAYVAAARGAVNPGDAAPS